jgi:hypothetical protein
MASPIFEAFSITHAQVLDGSTAFADVETSSSDWGDIYGVNQGSLTPDGDSYENQGDDATLSTWEWLNFAGLEIQAGYMSLPLIANLTSRDIASSGAGDTQLFELDLWHEDSFNVSPRPVILRMPSKDKNGVVRTLDIGLYKVSFAPVTFEGPQYKDGLKVNYNGKALLSATDELGAAHGDGKKRIGKLISRGLA